MGPCAGGGVWAISAPLARGWRSPGSSPSGGRRRYLRRVQAGEPSDEVRVSTVELFFDLVFVFTITQLTGLLAGDPSVRGLARVLLVFGNLWWMYGGYAWLTNAVPPRELAPRLLVLVGMAGFLVVALAIPDGFAGGGPRWALWAAAFALHWGTGVHRGGGLPDPRRPLRRAPRADRADRPGRERGGGRHRPAGPRAAGRPGRHGAAGPGAGRRAVVAVLRRRGRARRARPARGAGRPAAVAGAVRVRLRVPAGAGRDRGVRRGGWSAVAGCVCGYRSPSALLASTVALVVYDR